MYISLSIILKWYNFKVLIFIYVGIVLKNYMIIIFKGKNI